MHKRPQTAKAILRKKSNAGEFTKPNSQLHHKAILTKTAWYGHKNHMTTNGIDQKIQK
jgi:hypothetical protein